MAHFALIKNGKVADVIVVSNDNAPDEAAGQAFIANTLKLAGAWKQTSYNGNFRGTYAGIGFTYDADLDEFVAPAVESAPE
jgi:hypothetical protein